MREIPAPQQQKAAQNDTNATAVLVAAQKTSKYLLLYKDKENNDYKAFSPIERQNVIKQEGFISRRK